MGLLWAIRDSCVSQGPITSFLTTAFILSPEHRDPKTIPGSTQPFYHLPSSSAPTSNWAYLVLSYLPTICSPRTQTQGISKQYQGASQMS